MVPIGYMASAVMIEFINANLLACDMRVMAAVILLSTLHTKGVMSRMEGQVVPRGSPRYVNGTLAWVHPKRAAISLHVSTGVLIGTRVDL